MSDQTMSYEFQGTSHCSVGAMCDAIAYEWMTAGGKNSPADIDGFAAEGPEVNAEQCVEGWGLLELVEGSGSVTWLDARDSSAADVLAAFERFLAARPDRTAAAA